MTESNNSQKYLKTMQKFQECICQFLEEEANSEENFRQLEDIFNDTKIKDNKFELLSLLHLISKIANNYYRFVNFYCKIEKIIKYIKDDIIKYFSNSQIFNIFKDNKKILLFLYEEHIIIFDEFIVKKIISLKFRKYQYHLYFQPEIQKFMNENWFPKYDQLNVELFNNGWVEPLMLELPENFYEKRKEGENDSVLCELIRKDMIKEFVVYITKNNISPNSRINPSTYETNPFLCKRQFNITQEKNGFSLIEYAVFFGSIQIYNYLRIEKAELTELMWLLAIHGKNAEIIHSLEDNHVEMEDKTYLKYFYESIKCHHNDIANYFLNNFLKEEVGNSQDTFKKYLKYYNFAFLKNEFIDDSLFFYLCRYDYCALVDSLLKNKVIEINKKEIFFLFNLISIL